MHRKTEGDYSSEVEDDLINILAKIIITVIIVAGIIKLFF